MGRVCPSGLYLFSDVLEAYAVDKARGAIRTLMELCVPKRRLCAEMAMVMACPQRD